MISLCSDLPCIYSKSQHSATQAIKLEILDFFSEFLSGFCLLAEALHNLVNSVVKRLFLSVLKPLVLIFTLQMIFSFHVGFYIVILSDFHPSVFSRIATYTYTSKTVFLCPNPPIQPHYNAQSTF